MSPPPPKFENAREHRVAQRARFDHVYSSNPKYRMSRTRFVAVFALIAELNPESILDVGCGRGELIAACTGRGIKARGVELVESLCDGRIVRKGHAGALGWRTNAFDCVSLVDVLDFVVPGDEREALRECGRVARRFLVYTGGEKRGRMLDRDFVAQERTSAQWQDLAGELFPGATLLTWSTGKQRIRIVSF